MVDSNRVKGAAKDAVGKVKEAAGKATGNDSLEAKGKAEQVEGKAQKGVGRVKDAGRTLTK